MTQHLTERDVRSIAEYARIGLDGLGEMAEAWLEVNGIENFIKTMGALGKRAQALMGGASTGSRG